MHNTVHDRQNDIMTVENCKFILLYHIVLLNKPQMHFFPYFRPAVINNEVSTVCLPEKDYIVPSGTECYVTGWGETDGTERTSTIPSSFTACD